jgi:8-oxo-dGTP diphosphatase
VSPPRVRVVAAFIEREGRCLIQRRPPGGARGDLWEFPGGKREAGEDDAQALARECREELGVAVEVGARLWETEHDYADLGVSLALYRCRLVAGDPRAKDGQELAWAEPGRLAQYPFCEADRPFLAKLAEEPLGT